MQGKGTRREKGRRIAGEGKRTGADSDRMKRAGSKDAASTQEGNTCIKGSNLGEIAGADSSKDGIRINGFFIQLCAKEEGIRHEVINNPGIALGVAVYGRECGRVHDRFCTASTEEFMADIVGDLGVGEAGKSVMDRNTLTKSLMDGLAKGVIQVWLTAEDERKAVDRVEAVIHKHFHIVEDRGREVLGFVNGQEKGLALFLKEMDDLGLNRVEHTRLAALWLQAEDVTELPIKLHDADSR